MSCCWNGIIPSHHSDTKSINPNVYSTVNMTVQPNRFRKLNEHRIRFTLLNAVNIRSEHNKTISKRLAIGRNIKMYVLLCSIPFPPNPNKQTLSGSEPNTNSIDFGFAVLFVCSMSMQIPLTFYAYFYVVNQIRSKIINKLQQFFAKVKQKMAQTIFKLKRKLTEDGTQVTFKCLQNGLLDFLCWFTQELFASRAKQFVGLMMKIIHVHHL